jgi:betaine-aldehyde dehydrogenase
MGAIVSKTQFDHVMSYIESAKSEGAQLIAGGGPPSDPALAKGLFIESAIFAVTGKNRIAREEIFGPVLGVFKWHDEAEMLAEVNQVEYGLTASIWTNDLNVAHRTRHGGRSRLCLDQ